MFFCLQARVRINPAAYTVLRVMVGVSKDKSWLQAEGRKSLSTQMGGARGVDAGFMTGKGARLGVRRKRRRSEAGGWAVRRVAGVVVRRRHRANRWCGYSANKRDAGRVQQKDAGVTDG